MRRVTKRRARLSTAGVALLLAAPYNADLADAAEWSGQAGLSVAGEYDDNPRLLNQDEEGAVGVIVTPSVAIRSQLPRTTFELGGSLPFNKFEGTGSDGGEDLTSFDQHANASVTTETRLTSFGLNGTFDRQTTRLSEVEDSGDLADDATRLSYGGGARVSQQITRRDFLDLFGNAQDVSFDTDRLSDFRSYGGGAGYRHLLTKQDQIGFSSDYSRFDPGSDEDTQSDIVGARAIWIHESSPTLSLDLSAGGQFIWSEQGDGDRNTDLGFTVSGDVNWTPSPKDDLRLTFERSSVPSGTGTLQTRNRASAGYVRKLTRSVGLSLDIDFIMQEALDDQRGDDRIFVQAKPRIFWAPFQNWELSASYRFRRQEFTGSNETAYSNAVFVTISYSSPYIGLF